VCDFKSKEVVKVIWHKAASPPHTEGSIVFARRRQCAPHLVHQTGIHTVPVMILLNRIEYIDRRTHPAGMSWTGQFFALKIASASTSDTWFPGPTRLRIPNCILIGPAISSFCTTCGRESLYFTVGWLEFNVPFQHKYGYIRDERSGMESYPLTQWRKASDTLPSTLAAFLFSSHPKRERDREAHLIITLAPTSGEDDYRTARLN